MFTLNHTHQRVIEATFASLNSQKCPKNRFISSIYSWDPANFRVLSTKRMCSFMTTPTQKSLNQLLILMNYDYDGRTGPSQPERERSKNQLVIFSLLNRSVETCTTSGLNWIRNCRLWWILLKMMTLVMNQSVNEYLKRASSSQVDWKTLEGQNMYLRKETLSQWMQSTVSLK